MKTIRVLLAEDHYLVRMGFCALIEELDGMTMVAEAKDGRTALRLIAKHCPDVALMDISMPGLNGLEATRQISRDFPDVRVIMLSMHSDEHYVSNALQAGATGYLLKSSTLIEFESAIRAVARGETYFCSEVANRTRGEHSSRQLTSRQREVLQLLAEGNTTREIATILHISPKTVEAHRNNIMSRLDIHNLPGLVKYAIRSGVVAVE